MDGFAAVDFEFARQVLQRGIAALFLVAFVSSLNQFRPLLGERGLLPAPELLAWASENPSRAKLLRPTLFRRTRYTDRRTHLLVLDTAGVKSTYSRIEDAAFAKYMALPRDASGALIHKGTKP